MITPQPTTRHFRRPTTTATSLLQTIESVAARFGIESPVRIHGVTEALTAEPSPADVLRAAAAASVDAVDAAAWLDDTVERFTRAQAAEAIRNGLRGHRDNIARARAPQLLEALAPQLKKRAAATIAGMTKAAQALPAGAAALEAEAVIAADAATERGAVIAALGDLGALASVHEAGVPQPGVPAALHTVLPVVDLPQTQTEQITRLHRETVNPSEERDAVRALANDLERNGTDVALINVARGEHPGVTLAWAPTATEVQARSDRARTAFTQRVVDAAS